MDSRSRLSMTLKHLGGSPTHDIASFHGVSRQIPVVGVAIRRTFDAIIKEFPISPFPFDDEDSLERIAQGFKEKSTGNLFDTSHRGLFSYKFLELNQKVLRIEYLQF